MGDARHNRTTTQQHTQKGNTMKTTAILITLGIAYVAIDTMPAEIAGAIGLGFVTVIVATLIAAIVAIGKAAR